MVPIIVSCTTTSHNTVVVNKEPYHYVDSAFKKQLELFEMLAATHGITVNDSNLSITFGLVRNIKSEIVGTCDLDDVGVMVIKIHDESYKGMDKYEREELIFHELGHCMLARAHCSTKDSKNLPISLMYPEMNPNGHYKAHRKEMIDELFNIDPRCEQDDDDADAVVRTIRTPPNK
jgi:hypothetical protein